MKNDDTNNVYIDEAKNKNSNWAEEEFKCDIKDLIKQSKTTNNKSDELGDRIKGYEDVVRNYLTKRMPTIIRIDGKAFHTFTKGFDKPYDTLLMQCMWDTTKFLCENIMGCKLAYTQSDEITLLLTDYDKITTQAWFDKNIQKMVSVSASMATLAFNNSFRYNVQNYSNTIKIDLYNNYNKKLDKAMFDSRVFNIPKEEVCNAFIWRQQDATRNAIQLVGQANFSHSQLQNKSQNDIQEMLFQEKNINFNDFPVSFKRGVCIIKEQYTKENTIRSRWIADQNIPIFTQDRNYIEKYL